MNTTATSYIRVDKKTKQQAETFTKSLGMTFSKVMNQFLKHIVLTKGQIISRSDVEELEPSPYLKKLLREAREDREHDSPSFRSAKDSIVWLEKQGI